MLRKLLFLTLTILLLLLTACGGNVSNVQIEACESNLYSDADMQSAIEAAMDYFQDEFSGCTLTKIGYAGDEKTIAHSEWADRHDADEVIVLTSSFEVDASGGDGSLNPNSTYNNWMWILVRTGAGSWIHADHGY